MTCTWQGCKQQARHPQKAKDGSTWADLCLRHHRELDRGIKGRDARLMLRNWVKAQGGAEAATKRMLPGFVGGLALVMKRLDGEK